MSKRRDRRGWQLNNSADQARDVYSRGNPRDHAEHVRNNQNGHGPRTKSEPEVFYCPELSLVLPKKYHATPAQERAQVDGSLLEGGGQILRVSAALSCILAQPIHVTKIRACRPKPGLSAQHLSGLRLVAIACEGDLIGGMLRSTDIMLTPGCVRSGEFQVDTKGAGSVALLIQTILPCLLFGPDKSSLLLKGGTDADFAPPIDYFTQTFLHYAQLFGVRADVPHVRRGFNPRGGGEVKLNIEPLRILSPVKITERGEITQVIVTVYLCGSLPSSLGERCLHTAEQIIKRRFSATKVPVKARLCKNDEAFGNGWGLRISAETAGGCLLTSCGNGNPKISPERLASDTAERVIKDIDEGGCVDSYMQDQLIILMGLASGVSQVRSGPLTLHTKTAIHLLESLTTAQFTVTKDPNPAPGEQSYVIECRGIALENAYLTQSNSCPNNIA